MASATTIYNPFRKYLLDGTIDLNTDTIMVALVTSAYTPSAEHADWAAVSANEVATGNGYTTGGQALANLLSTHTAGTAKWTADNPVWAALTKTFRYAVLYADKVANGVTDPLIAYILLDTTPADIVVSGADYSIQWNASGIITLSSA